MSLLVAASNPLQSASGLPRRVANRRAAAACLAWLAGSVLAVTGCSGQASVALPHKAAPSAGVPIAVTDPPLTVRDQVIAAYTGYWEALGQALDTQNAGRARTILAQFVPAVSISSLISSFEADWAQGEIQYGSPVPHIISVHITGGQAAVHDCADFSNAGVQDARTGQVVGSLGNPHVNLISTLVLTHGKWLVTNQVPVVLSCVP